MTARTKRRAIPAAIAAVAAVAAAAGGSYWWHTTRLPRRFAPVVAGRLYRSGEVTPAQLERLQRDFGIGRVICLLASDDPDTRAERQAAERLGITWCNVPLTGNGASTAEDRAWLIELLTMPDAPPTLVHCAAGANRTGLAVGLYRIHCQNWTYEQVLAEMKTFDFEDLPKHENLRQALRAAAATTSDKRE